MRNEQRARFLGEDGLDSMCVFFYSLYFGILVRIFSRKREWKYFGDLFCPRFPLFRRVYHVVRVLYLTGLFRSPILDMNDDHRL